MRYRSFLLTACLGFAVLSLPAQSISYQYPFQNPALSPEARIDDLLGRMTLQEKISALSTDPSVPRDRKSGV